MAVVRETLERGAPRRAASGWAAGDPTCAVAQAALVVGDRWSLVVLREVARGRHRFDELVDELHISRKVLAERLAYLVDHGVLRKVAYQTAPTRYDYLLTDAGHAFLPVLVALQDWGDQWVLGDGRVTATSHEGAAEARRVHDLVGQPVPDRLTLPATRGGTAEVVAAGARGTVLFGYPATGAPTPLPENWSDIPGAVGCTLENRLFRDAYDEFIAAGIAVRGLSTQRPDEQQRFADAERIPFPLLSDADLQVAAALRLPTFRAGGAVRLRRVVLLLGPDRVVRHVRYPVTDIADTVRWSLDRLAAA